MNAALTSSEAPQEPTVRPIWPMNEDRDPIDWPLAQPSTLSEDAQRIYRMASSGRRLDRDWFDSKAVYRYVSREEAEAYRPSERVLAAIEEIVAVRLGSFNPETNLLMLTRVSEHYTVAQGRGSQLIRAYIRDEETTDDILLAVLVGGDLESRGIDNRSGISELTVRARHETATDVEHDASSTAMLTISAPSFPTFRGYGHLSFTGFLTEARLYPLGADPLTQEDEDGDYDPTELCERCDDPHPYAPYLPPEVELPLTRKGLVVKIECLPLRPYLVVADGAER